LRLERIGAAQIHENIITLLRIIVLHKKKQQIGFKYIWNVCLHMKKLVIYTCSCHHILTLHLTPIKQRNDYFRGHFQ